MPFVSDSFGAFLWLKLSDLFKLENLIFVANLGGTFGVLLRLVALLGGTFGLRLKIGDFEVFLKISKALQAFFHKQQF